METKFLADLKGDPVPCFSFAFQVVFSVLALSVAGSKVCILISELALVLICVYTNCYHDKYRFFHIFIDEFKMIYLICNAYHRSKGMQANVVYKCRYCPSLSGSPTSKKLGPMDYVNAKQSKQW